VVLKLKIRLGSGDCKDWVIVGFTDEEDDDKILWKCPFSENAWIPPKNHWEPVDELASGTPEVKYCSPRGGQKGKGGLDL
jgi:hypothetical protein